MTPPGGKALRRGCRVRLKPSQRADIVDLALAGRIAVVDRVEQGVDGSTHVVVSLDGDPALDLGPMSQIGHRFFFAPEEVEPVADQNEGPRVLVGGVGDVYRTGGSFGRDVVETLGRTGLPDGVRAADFGIRTGDLANALHDHDIAVLVSAVRQGNRPGTLTVTELTVQEFSRYPGIDLPASVEIPDNGCRIFLVTCESAAEPEPASVRVAAVIVWSLVDFVIHGDSN